MFLVAFLDILGFAHRVASLPETDQEGLSRSLQAAGNEARYDRSLSPAARSLLFDFKSFQDIVSRSAGRLRAESRTFLFSDCAFVASTDAVQILDFCDLVYEWMFHAGIPIRGGLGFGGLAIVGVGSSVIGPHSASSCLFLGSGVVAAHRAESSGLKGLRLFVHRSAAEVINSVRSKLLVELPPKERREDVLHECNLGLLSSTGADGFHRRTVYLCQARKMRRAAPSWTAKQYRSTEAALSRMGINKMSARYREIEGRTQRPS